jgi:hypothetical protein
MVGRTRKVSRANKESTGCFLGHSGQQGGPYLEDNLFDR